MPGKFENKRERNCKPVCTFPTRSTRLSWAPAAFFVVVTRTSSTWKLPNCRKGAQGLLPSLAICAVCKLWRHSLYIVNIEIRVWLLQEIERQRGNSVNFSVNLVSGSTCLAILGITCIRLDLTAMMKLSDNDRIKSEMEGHTLFQSVSSQSQISWHGANDKEMNPLTKVTNVRVPRYILISWSKVIATFRITWASVCRMQIGKT